jgi:hypothetical protein
MPKNSKNIRLHEGTEKEKKTIMRESSEYERENKEDEKIKMK